MRFGGQYHTPLRKGNELFMSRRRILVKYKVSITHSKKEYQSSERCVLGLLYTALIEEEGIDYEDDYFTLCKKKKMKGSKERKC